MREKERGRASRKRRYAAFREFAVDRDTRRDFESFYGTDGRWPQLFRRSPGFLRSELYEKAGDPGRCVILDLWESRESWERFQSEFEEECRALQGRCDRWRGSARHLGEFVMGPE